MTASLFATPRPLVALPLGITLPGAPRTKKNSGTIGRRGGRMMIVPSAAWMGWRDKVLMAHKDVWRANYRLDIELNIAARFYRDAATGDACGYYSGLADLLEELRVVANDKFLVSWDGSRLLRDVVCPRTEIVLSAYSG
jgi:hypothetical protein